jgi:hypothetical protein
MADRYFNPFQGIDVYVPSEYHEDMLRYSQREQRATIDHSPFPRMVDMWFLSMCVAAREGLQPAEVGKYKTTKIIDGSIFGSDPWRVDTLMLLAIATTGSVDVVSEPRRIMAIANGLAIAGMPKLLEMLKDGAGEPIWNLSEEVDKLLRRKAA